MSDDEKDDELGIHRVETIPPPEGEDDAYSAATKVGPMADAAVKELMHAAERRASELSARVAEKKSAAAAAAKSSATPTPLSVKPATPSAKPAAPASARPAAPSGPTTGRVPAPAVGPVGRTVSAAPTGSAKPPSIPRPAAIPRVDAPPAAAPPLSSKEKDTLSPEPLTTPQDGAPPRLYDASDEPDDGPTLLHKSAKAPQQEQTALIPAAHTAAKPSASVPVPGATLPPFPPPAAPPREPIPFDRPMLADPRAQAESPVLIMPLAVGFLIFALGLAFYIWAR